MFFDCHEFVKHVNVMDLQYIDLRTVPHLPLASENIFRGGARCSIEKGVSGYNCSGKCIATKPPRSPPNCGEK